MSEAAQLGNIATRLPKRPVNSRGRLTVPPEDINVLEWDAANLRFKNSPAANALLTRTYRKGWDVTPA
ncbi:MAG: hypothetical protein JNL92_14700 [Opitutaceae bacterium]|nr:hypothetical protein [Opitutaceae bacterium]